MNNTRNRFSPEIRDRAVRMRDELLNESLFFGLDHARSAIAEWRQDYNTTSQHPRDGCSRASLSLASLGGTPGRRA